MARHSQSACYKGSQKWIQRLVNERQELLNLRITKESRLPEGDDITWLSPLKDDDYAEYSDEGCLRLLGVNLEKRPLTSFWPQNGPQWDALGRSRSGKLFLVEAKSHISELVSSIRAKDRSSVQRIRQSLEETKDFLNSSSEVDWSFGFYQYVNRLAHLYLLRQNQLPAYLVSVYFVNDSEMQGPTSINQWKGAIELLHSFLGIRRHKLQFMADVFIDVDDLE